ncbi:hypothetical protein ACERK3_19570 [Phycisphaerales bacterium AB-hyl4]|uniref:Uncharacterized protein n=1 Tax=Natronomicrosphaera hydrolytica TaxID=3242702 RepID=A0ABV4UAV3_9BACT
MSKRPPTTAAGSTDGGGEGPPAEGAPTPTVAGRPLLGDGEAVMAATLPPRSGGLSLDQEENKSPQGLKLLDPNNDVMVIPEYSGGKLDPYGGTGKRIADLRKFEALVAAMVRAVMLTLTIDRSQFENPEQAFDEVMPKLSRLLSERLGVKVWARVAEVQTKSGDGWIHWHILADLAGTRFETRPGFADLRAFNAAVRECWCERWSISQPAGVDTQLVRSKSGIVGYIAKYLVKPWPAIPPWIGERKLFRLVGFSKAANELLRLTGLLPERREPRWRREQRKRPLESIFKRCAASGLMCKVIHGGRWLGRLSAKAEHVMLAIQSGLIPGTLRRRVFENAVGRSEKVIAVLNEASRHVVDRVNVWLHAHGLSARIESEYQHRLTELCDGWKMVCEQNETIVRVGTRECLEHAS